MTTTSFIRRTVVPGQAYAAVDIDTVGGGAVAVAWKTPEGWRVGLAGGRVVADKLTQQQALGAMHRAADHELNRMATANLLEAVGR